MTGGAPGLNSSRPAPLSNFAQAAMGPSASQAPLDLSYVFPRTMVPFLCNLQIYLHRSNIYPAGTTDADIVLSANSRHYLEVLLSPVTFRKHGTAPQ